MGRQASVKAGVMVDQVGHASVLMTQDIYSHLEDPRRRGQEDRYFRLVRRGRTRGANSPQVEPYATHGKRKPLKWVVGARRFELRTSCSRSRRASYPARCSLLRSPGFPGWTTKQSRSSKRNPCCPPKEKAKVDAIMPGPWMQSLA